MTKDDGQWQPHRPMKAARRKIQMAHSIYDLPSKEQAIKWMHIVLGYPVKSTWIKAIKAETYIGWPMLTKRNAARYYPDTKETPKCHLNQSRKNIRSTKPKRITLEVPKTATHQVKKTRDIYASVCEVRNTIFSGQTGQFPTRPQ